MPLGLGGWNDLERPVVVAMVAVLVVQVTADEVVDVVAVWHRLVPAFRAVLVFGLVLGAVAVACAVGGVEIADRNCVTVDGGAGVVVQLAVVQVVHVIVVADGRVPAGGAVLVFVWVAHAVLP